MWSRRAAAGLGMVSLSVMLCLLREKTERRSFDNDYGGRLSGTLGMSFLAIRPRTGTLSNSRSNKTVFSPLNQQL